MEVNIIKSKLDFYEIPVLLKHHRSGASLSVLSGCSDMAIDKYVKDITLEDSRKMLDMEGRGSV